MSPSLSSTPSSSSTIIVKKESRESLRIFQDCPDCLDQERSDDSSLRAGRDNINADCTAKKNGLGCSSGALPEAVVFKLSKLSIDPHSDSDESPPSSPAPKGIPVHHGTITFAIDYCVYFTYEQRDYCWGITQDYPFDSQVFQITGTQQDGKPMLQIRTMLPSAGMFYKYWNGFHFFLPYPEFDKRKLYMETADGYQPIELYNEYAHLSAYRDTGMCDLESSSVFAQLEPENSATSFQNQSQYAPSPLGWPPLEPSTTQYASPDVQPPPNTNPTASDFLSAEIVGGTIRVTRVPGNEPTRSAIDEFVNTKLSGVSYPIYCHLCPEPKRDKLCSTRPYSLKAHFESHFFKWYCQYCGKGYSNKANMKKNHPICPLAPPTSEHLRG